MVKLLKEQVNSTESHLCLNLLWPLPTVLTVLLGRELKRDERPLSCLPFLFPYAFD